MNAVRAAFAVLLAAFWFAFAAAAPAKAFDDSDIQRIDIAIKSARAALNEIISTTDPASINEDAIAQQRNALGKLKTTATATAKELDQPQADVTA